MPTRKGCGSLYRLSVASGCKLLLSGCQRVDAQTDPFQLPENVNVSPSKLVISPSRDDVDLDLCEDQRKMKTWLGNLPDTVVEDVVSAALQDLEAQLMVDNDKKLIMTLIKIETIKMNDFFFGIHSLLKILRGFHINDLNISKGLWSILWDYEQLLSKSLLREAVAGALPHLPLLTTLNLPYLADDRLMMIIGRCLPGLTSLDISHGMVTDRGVRSLVGASHQSPSPRRSVVRNLTPLLDNNELSSVETLKPSSIEARLSPVKSPRPKLDSLRLEACGSITDYGIVFILENYTNLRNLIYQQRRSVLEIILSWTSHLDRDKIKDHALKLEHLEHVFPYGISPFSEHISLLHEVCPNLTSLNLVTEDYVLPYLSGCAQLTCLSVELEDCVGEGFISFLESKGHQLKELTVSSSTDPESSMESVDGGQQGHLFNLAVLAAATYCSKIVKLSVSGCGLVSTGAVESLDLMTKLNSSYWLRSQARSWFRCLEVLVLMSYEDSLPSMTIHSVLLLNILKTVSSLQVLSLEGNFGSFITDEYIRSVTEENPLNVLRILDISVQDQGGLPGRIPLTVNTAQLLMEKCANLTELRMSDWRLTDEEFASLLDQVRNNNWNLVLTRKIRST